MTPTKLTDKGARLLNNIAAAPQMRSVQWLTIFAFITGVWGAIGEANQKVVLDALHISSVWQGVLGAIGVAILARILPQANLPATAPAAAPGTPPVLTDAVDIPAGEPGFEPTQMAPPPESATDQEWRAALAAVNVPEATIDKIQTLRDLRRRGLQ